MKMSFNVLYIVGLIIALWYGFILGKATQTMTTTYESDLKACVNICEPNGGVESVNTSVYCTCENGGLFTERDLR